MRRFKHAPGMSALRPIADVSPRRSEPSLRANSGLQAQETLLKRQAAVYNVLPIFRGDLRVARQLELDLTRAAGLQGAVGIVGI